MDNTNGKYSIFEAYNHGAEQSKYDHLIFLHEDVVIHTKGADEILIKTLQDKSVGVVGVAGSVYKSRLLSSWVDVPTEYYRSSILQSNKPNGANQRKSEVLHRRNNDVVVLDGMFLAMRKDVWEKFPFDEKLYSGFHLYDLDISMMIGRKYRLVVCNEILVEHLSRGSFSKEWYKDSEIFHKKWKNHLPAASQNLAISEKRNIEHFVSIKSINYHAVYAQAIWVVVKLIFVMFYYRPFSRYNWIVVCRTLKKRMAS
jgi:hypothetical protein